MERGIIKYAGVNDDIQVPKNVIVDCSTMPLLPGYFIRVNTVRLEE